MSNWKPTPTLPAVLLVFCAWGLMFYHYRPMPPAPQIVFPGMRDEFIALNRRMVTLFRQARLSKPQLVNVGTAPGDGTGDTLTVAIHKVNADLDALEPYVLAETP